MRACVCEGVSFMYVVSNDVTRCHLVIAKAERKLVS